MYDWSPKWHRWNLFVTITNSLKLIQNILKKKRNCHLIHIPIKPRYKPKIPISDNVFLYPLALNSYCYSCNEIINSPLTTMNDSGLTVVSFRVKHNSWRTTEISTTWLLLKMEHALRETQSTKYPNEILRFVSQINCSASVSRPVNIETKGASRCISSSTTIRIFVI